MSQPTTAINETSVPVTKHSDQPWLRLSSRMIWVDLAQTVLAVLPLVVAMLVFGLEDNLWPLIIVAGMGAWGAVQDAVRWVFTRYRITENYVELRTGIVTRSYRSVKRDRIRSVDVEAKLRHRLSGLRIVKIGAGQQTAANESAFDIDAVLKSDAEDLRHLLLKRQAPAQASKAASTVDDKAEVYARLRPWWAVYNMFSIWSYVMAAGLLWGGYWLLMTFGVDAGGWVGRVIEAQAALPLGWFVLGVVLAVGAFGAIGMGINFFTEYWKFELARVPGEKHTSLRTRQGLFTTKEINRDDSRLRGANISEPVFWRWMRAADTSVITTGLSIWSVSQPTAVIPRAPLGAARSVAGMVLGDRSNPFEAPLRAHPVAALRRRLTWATATAGVLAAVLAWLATNGIIPMTLVWTAAGVWALGLVAALIAYRALGHAIVGQYLVVRSGLTSRSTSVLQRKAVSTIVIRQSPLQWRLGLKTVSAMTSAGWMAYDAIDLDADKAVEFANQAAPGLLEPFLISDK